MSGLGLYTRRLWIGALAVALGWTAGCLESDRPKTIPISGRVTLDGQPPGEGGRIHFAPIQPAAGYAKRPASGSFVADGSYRVMSWEPDDGLVPGRYAVDVMPADPAKSAIPARYHQNGTSGLEVDVPVSESRIEYNIELVTD